MIKKNTKLIFIFIVFSLVLVSCFPRPPKHTERDIKELIFRGKTMGTTYLIRILIGLKVEKVAHYKKDIDEILENINQSMSTWIENSEINTLNRKKFLDHPSLDFYQVSELAYQIKSESYGYFEPAIGELIELWGFNENKNKKTVPNEREINLLRDKISSYQIDKAKKKMTLSKEIKIDYNAIAKGYAVDKISEYLQSKKFARYMIEVGGEVAAFGSNIGGLPWIIGIRRPSKVPRLQKAIILKNAAMATSGDYENYFAKNGKRYSHIINPKTGYPIKHDLVSVTVVASNCVLADAWATALLTMGAEKAMKLAKKKKMTVFLIRKNSQEKNKARYFIEEYTESFSSLITKVRQSL